MGKFMVYVILSLINVFFGRIKMKGNIFNDGSTNRWKSHENKIHMNLVIYPVI
jgi:hypothetical protein